MPSTRLVHGHGAGEGGDLAVVDDLERDAVPIALEVEEDVFHAAFEVSGETPRKSEATLTSLFT
jgi:hypothetical protein